MSEKILPLDDIVLINHKQKYEKSCVPMSIELVLKLMGVMKVDDYRLQDEKGNESRWGAEYHENEINNVKIIHSFDSDRDDQFPMDELFKKIEEELDNDRFVQCVWKNDDMQDFHAYVIYGYNDNEYLAITYHAYETDVIRVDDMKSRLSKIQGSDILTFEI